MKLSISETLGKLKEMETQNEKVEWLQKNNSPAIQIILRLTYDKGIEFLIPDSKPPWKKNKHTDAHTLLYNEARRLRIFIKGGGYDQLPKVKREMLFISLLEDVDNDDAEMLCDVIQQKPFPGLDEETVKLAFPQLFQIKLS